MPDWIADGLDWLGKALSASREVPADRLLARLLLAFVLGCAVALLYRLTQRRGSPEATNFVTTLVMLAVLMAVVTQVIGDNTARAFSLVGALAIVRFRTVVEDTRDIAFVVFAVAIGMAVGAGYPAVAAGTLAVGGAAAGLVRPRGAGKADPRDPSLGVGAGGPPGSPLGEVFPQHPGRAPQGRNISAQGNALGPRETKKDSQALKGRNRRATCAFVAPFQGLVGVAVSFYPGRCPGLICSAPAGQKPVRRLAHPGLSGVCVNPTRGHIPLAATAGV